MKTQHIMSLVAASSPATHELFSKQRIENHVALRFPGHEAAVRSLELYYDHLRLSSAGTEKARMDDCPSLAEPGAITFHCASGHNAEPENQPWEILEAISMSSISAASFKYLIGEGGRCGTISVNTQEDGAPVYHPPSKCEESDCIPLESIPLEEIKVTPEEALKKAMGDLEDGFSLVTLKRSGSGKGEPEYTFHGRNLTLVHVGATNGYVRLEDEWDALLEELEAAFRELETALVELSSTIRELEELGDESEEET